MHDIAQTTIQPSSHPLPIWASLKFQILLIIRDVKLDSNKWNGDKFLHKNVSMTLQEALDTNGLSILDVGNSYLANHLQKNAPSLR